MDMNSDGPLIMTDEHGLCPFFIHSAVSWYVVRSVIFVENFQGDQRFSPRFWCLFSSTRQFLIPSPSPFHNFQGVGTLQKQFRSYFYPGVGPGPPGNFFRSDLGDRKPVRGSWIHPANTTLVERISLILPSTINLTKLRYALYRL
jgi:hypothetical protein